MKATEAKQIAQSAEKSDMTIIYLKIKNTADSGRYAVNFPKLSKWESDQLQVDGYNVVHNTGDFRESYDYYTVSWS